MGIEKELSIESVFDDEGQYIPVKFASISASDSGDNTLVLAVTAKKIRVLGYTIVSTTAVGCRFEDGAGGTALTGVMPLGVTGVLSVFDPKGLFETSVATLLNLELSGAVLVAGHLSYCELD